MKKHILCLFTTLLFSCALSAQSNPLDKKMEKAASLADKGKFKDAAELMEKLLAENPDFGKGWDFLSILRYQEYLTIKNSGKDFNAIITVSTKNEKGEDIPLENDSLSRRVQSLLNAISPSKKAFAQYKYTLRKATLLCNNAYKSSVSLRTTFVDLKTDTNVSQKAHQYFILAEDEFQKENYSSAGKLYQKALDEQPDYYKAGLYLGDCYYFAKDYPNAVKSFKAAIDRFPTLIEPRKYLVDAYSKQQLYSLSFDEAVNCMALYPDESMMVKLRDAAYLLDKRVNIKRLMRGVFPNRMPESWNINESQINSKEKEKVLEPWTKYQEALEKIKPFCNEKGIITKSNTLTQSQYLELYSWEYMLENSKDPSLAEARKMQKEGYLDCYIFVTCFHYDIYDQFIDFATNHKSKIKDYFNKYTY